MKNLLMLLLLLGNITICSAQTEKKQAPKTYINAIEFKKLKHYALISSDLIQTEGPKAKVAMELKILDYSDGRIKYFLAPFNDEGYVPLPSKDWLNKSLDTKKNYINRSQFDSLKHYTVMSTSTLETTAPDGKAALELKLLDYKDKNVKYYIARLNEYGYVGLSTKRYPLTSLQNFSIMTVPFKVRSRNTQGQVTVKADIKNVGLYLPGFVWDYKRYWLDNTSTNHKFSIGVLVAPMAEDLTDANTKKYFENSASDPKDRKQPYTAFMLSTSIAATYTYKSITLAMIPIGFDFGMDKAGKEWINNGKYWFGFGVGIDTKLFGF